MRLALTAALTILICVANAHLAGAQTAPVDHKRIAREALANHIRPSYAELTGAFDSLRSETESFCLVPGKTGPDKLRKTFADAVRAWGRIAHIQFGPVRENNRYERIWFWPDRKGIAHRQVANAIRNQPKGYDDAKTLGEKSIAVQGLGAFEQILYGPEIEALKGESGQTAFLCRYLQAIAGNLARIASAIETGWSDQNYGRIWLNPGPDNPSYLKDQETTFALAKAFMNGVERVRDVELARPLGVTQGRRILSGPFAGSKLSMVFIAARIEGLRALFVKSGLSRGLQQAAEVSESRTAKGDLRQILFELKLAEKRATELAEIPGLLGNESERGKAIPLGFPLKSIQQMSARALGDLTDMPVGFNASDGD